MKTSEAVSAMQKRGLDALQAAQSMQLASLETTRDYVRAFSASAAPMMFPVVREMTELMTTFTLQLFDQQVTYAKQLAEMFDAANAAKSPPPLAVEAPPPASIAATPDSTIDAAQAPPPDAAPLPAFPPPGEATAPARSPAESEHAATSWFDSPAASAESLEALSKLLPAPHSAPTAIGPRLIDLDAKSGPRSSANPAKKKPSVPAVSTTRDPLQGGSGKKKKRAD